MRDSFWSLIASLLAGCLLAPLSLPAQEKPSLPVSKPPAASSLEPNEAAGSRPAASPRVQTLEELEVHLKDKNGDLVPLLGYRLEDFYRLLNQKPAEPGEAAPSYSIQTLSANGVVRGEHAELTVTFRYVVRGDDWVRVPLRLDQAVLRGTAKHKGSGKQFLHWDATSGYVSWVQGGKGEEQELTLDVLAPVILLGNETRMRLSAPRAASAELKLTVPSAGVQAEVSEGATLLPAASLAEGRTLLSVLGLGADFELRWRKSGGAVETYAALESAGLISMKLDSRGVESKAKLTVSSFGGAFDTFRIRLPKGADLLPETQSGYTLTPVPMPGASVDEPKIVEVRLPRKTVGPVEVQLAARQKAEPAVWWELGGFEVVDAARESGYFFVTAGSLWHLSFGAPRGIVRQVDKLPGLLQGSEWTSGDPAVFEYSGASIALPVRVISRKSQVSVEPSYLVRVDAAKITLIATLKYGVRSADTTNLTVELPRWEVDDVGPESVVAGACEVSPSGVLSVPLAPRSVGQVDVRIRAHQNIAPGAETISFELPRPRADTQAPATFIILPADDVELTPQTESTIGLVRQQVAPQQLRQLIGTLGESARQQEPVFYRGEPAKASKAAFGAKFRIQPQKVSVAVHTRLTLDEKATEVRQRLSYTVAHTAVEYLTLEIPAALSAEDSLSVSVDGKAAPLLDDSTQPAADGTVRKRVKLPEPRIGICDLEISFPFDLPHLPLKTPVTAQVPLVMPGDGELTDNTVSVAAKHGFRVQPVQSPWTISEMITPYSSQQPGVSLQCKQRASELGLEICLEDPAALGSTVVNRAWIQSLLTQPERIDRAVYRLTSNQRSLELVLPAGVDLDEVELRLDGRAATSQVTPEGHVVVALPSDNTSEQQHVLEAIYRFSEPRSEPGAMAMELPRLGRDVWVQRMYWQLVLPAKEHLVVSPGGLTPEFTWSWDGLFWGRKPLLEQPDLETWVGARRRTAVPANTNRYLFSEPDSVGRVELCTAMRPMIVLGASGITLVLGLFLIHVPAARHPSMLLVLAVALAAGAILFPEMGLLGLQAASLGIALALVAGLLQRNVGRRRRPVPREVSSSILEKSTTQGRRRAAVVGSETPTDSAPAIASPGPEPQP